MCLKSEVTSTNNGAGLQHSLGNLSTICGIAHLGVDGDNVSRFH